MRTRTRVLIAGAAGRDRYQKHIGIADLLDRLARGGLAGKGVDFDAGEVVSLCRIAHGARDVREAAAVLAYEVPDAVAEAKDEKPHASP